MPQLRPFRALRYDLRALGLTDAGALLCPPYDVISADERRRLAALHPSNSVHVELPAEATGRPNYEAAALLFARWQAEGVLRRDERPSIYGYEQLYHAPDGRLATARGFFCLLRLEPLAPGGGVRAHERTMSGPKEDRLRLLRAVRANLSPVMLLYASDADGSASARLLDELMSSPPALQALGADGRAQRLWVLAAETSPLGEALLDLAGRNALTIADGHHRYETALRYCDEQRAHAGVDPAAAEPAAWLLVLLVDAASGGLSVLPTHRLVQARRDPAAVLEAARDLFAVTPIASADELLAVLGRPGRLGLSSAAGHVLLEPRREPIEPLLPAGMSEALRWLDVTVLTSALPGLVGEEPEALLADGRLDYVKDTREVLARAAAGERGYAFLLPPTPVPAVLQVAAAGEQMPHKSTYFEPKPATGLVFNSLLA